MKMRLIGLNGTKLGEAESNEPRHAIGAQANVTVPRSETFHLCFGFRKRLEAWGWVRRMPIGWPGTLVLILHTLSVTAELAVADMNTGAPTWRNNLQEIGHGMVYPLPAREIPQLGTIAPRSLRQIPSVTASQTRPEAAFSMIDAKAQQAYQNRQFVVL